MEKKEQLDLKIRRKIADAMLENRANYTTDSACARSMGISPAIFSRIGKGEIENILKSEEWIRIGRSLEVSFATDPWVTAETEVYIKIKESLDFCQKFAKSILLVDDCGIGKTYCAVAIIKKMKNAYYVDCSQHKTKRQLIKALSKIIGIGTTGNYVDMLENLKYYINSLCASGTNALFCLDEAGDLSYEAFLELKGLMNASVGTCGWYVMGADGLRAKIQRGINNNKVGYREIFDRLSATFDSIVPAEAHKKDFYQKLIGDVAYVNCQNKALVNKYIAKCMTQGKKLRFLETIIKVDRYENA